MGIHFETRIKPEYIWWASIVPNWRDKVRGAENILNKYANTASFATTSNGCYTVSIEQLTEKDKNTLLDLGFSLVKHSTNIEASKVTHTSVLSLQYAVQVYEHFVEKIND